VRKSYGKYSCKINIPTTRAWVSDIREFAEIIKGMLEQIYPSGSVVIHEQAKNNGLKRTGISVREDGCHVAPIVYLEELYRQNLAGKPLTEICRVITETSQSLERNKYSSIRAFADFSVAQERICYKLVNAGKNAALLREIPHRLWQDLAVIYYILILKEPEGISSIHETLFMPALPYVEERELLEMVHEINTGYVAPGGFLSDNVYRYHAEDGCVRAVS
jgi:hypothetical protein